MEIGYRGKGKYVWVVLFLFTITSVHPQTDLKMLEKAYEHNSKEELKYFFDTWSREILPITDTELSTYNDTIQQAYKVFAAFYKPHRLDSIGGSYYNAFYKNVKYFIVQNAIGIYFSDEKLYYTEQEKREWLTNKFNELYKDNDSIRQDLLKQIGEARIDYACYGCLEHLFDRYYYDEIEEKIKEVDHIINFRPQINCGNKIPCYLSPKYETLLYTFLGNNLKKNSKKRSSKILLLYTKEQIEERKYFLENFVKIDYGHWVRWYWQLCSYPLIYEIIFDKEMKHARIKFQVVYKFGEAILKKEGEAWILISSKLTRQM